jgi:hypothetical protein
MTALTEAYIDSLALNAAAIKNGHDLVRKNSYVKLCMTEDQTLLFGDCKGSGKVPYSCSADFQNEGQPVFRCSCPSRQFPCKHILGLLYAYAGGKPFTTEALPADIADKREKAEQREQKREEKLQKAAENGETAPKRKVNKAALAKKLAAQLEGVLLAEKLIRQLVQAGLAAVDARMARECEEQAKQLGNFFVPGIQIAVRELLQTLEAAILAKGQASAGECHYTEAMERLASLHTLLKRAKEHLGARLENAEHELDASSAIEELIGHAWQLAELRELGRTEADTELLQLSFRSYEDKARGEHVDEGCWINLGSGELVITRNYRPFRAAKHMKEEDSCYSVASTKELFKYPGEWSVRVRWEEATLREATKADYAFVCSQAEQSLPAALKKVKNELKNPLGLRRPLMLLRAATIGVTENGYVMCDAQGNRLQLVDLAATDRGTLELLPYLPARLLQDSAVLVMFEDRLEEGRLVAQPLSVCTNDGIVRLLY